jgi:hypothetical protein
MIVGELEINIGTKIATNLFENELTIRYEKYMRKKRLNAGITNMPLIPRR